MATDAGIFRFDDDGYDVLNVMRSLDKNRICLFCASKYIAFDEQACSFLDKKAKWYPRNDKGRIESIKNGIREQKYGTRNT